MKQFISLVLSGLLLLVASALFNVPFASINDSPVWMSYVAMPIVVVILHSIALFTVVGALFIPVSIFGFWADFSVKESLSISFIVGIFVWLFTLPFVMTGLVPNKIEWFPQFTWWQYGLILLTSMLLSWPSSEKK